MPGVALELVLDRLERGENPFGGRVGPRNIPESAFRGGIEVDLAGIVICPERDAPDDRIGGSSSKDCCGSISAGHGGHHCPVLQDIKPAHRHGSRVVGGACSTSGIAPCCCRIASEALDSSNSIRIHNRIAQRRAVRIQDRSVEIRPDRFVPGISRHVVVVRVGRAVLDHFGRRIKFVVGSRRSPDLECANHSRLGCPNEIGTGGGLGFRALDDLGLDEFDNRIREALSERDPVLGGGGRAVCRDIREESHGENDQQH